MRDFIVFVDKMGGSEFKIALHPYSPNGGAPRWLPSGISLVNL